MCRGKESAVLIVSLINIFHLKSHYLQMLELHGSEINLENVGFTYPEDSDMDSLEQLKQHEIRLSQTKDALLGQQTRLKRILQNLKKLKQGKFRKLLCHYNIKVHLTVIGQFWLLYDSLCLSVLNCTLFKKIGKQVNLLIT